MNSQTLAKECVRAADEFLARRLWQRFANENLIAFEVPGRELVIGSIMGAAGEEFGLLLFQGPRAFEDFAQMLAADGGEPGDWESTLLSVSLTRAKDLDAPFLRVLRQAGRTGGTVPLFFVKEAHRIARAPRREELETLLFALRGLLLADDRHQLAPDTWVDPRVMPVLRLDGDPRQPTVAVARTRIAAAAAAPARPAIAAAGLADLPRLETTYCVGMPVAPMLVEDEEDELRVLAVLDLGSDQLRTLDMVLGLDLETAAAHLFACLRGDGPHAVPGLPRQLVFASEPLYHALADGLSALGVDCSFAEHVPALELVLADFAAHLDRQAGEPPEQVDRVPEADDLDGWKEIDAFARRLMADTAGPSTMAPERPWQRYFGGGDEPSSRDLVGPRGERMLRAFLHWLLFDYRATKRSRTLVQRLLDQRLPPAVRQIVEAQNATRPALYRVAAIAAGGSLDFVDVQTGAQVRIEDRALAQSASVGMVCFAHVFPAGAFHFAVLLSPPLGALDADAALAFLAREHGLTSTSPIPPTTSHLLGRLWSWTAQRGGTERIRLTNTDGHALLGQIAAFQVGDPAALVAALGARADLTEHEPGATWVWLRGSTHLGRLEFFGDELLLETNSAERCAAARAWLEAIPGVRFVSVDALDLDPRRADERPLDDRLPAAEKEIELDAAELAELQRLLDSKYLAWLDESIPALGNKTPRQACRTATGRQQVTRLIRTYPDPMGTPGLRVPRAEMLRRLGLDATAADETR